LVHGRSSIPAREHVEAAAEAGEDLLDGESLQPARGQFNRQRYAIKAPAQLGSGKKLFALSDKRRGHRGSTTQQQVDGVALNCAFVRNAQRGDAHDGLRADA
jgi:hypothetical protein